MIVPGTKCSVCGHRGGRVGQVSEGDGGRDVGGSGHLGGGPHRGHQ